MPSDSIDWSSVIYRGAESEELDYKAAQNWNELSRAGRAKFVRHCLAMANTKGGYIVVGVGEDGSGRPVNLTGLDAEQSRSFDPTAVGNFISRFSDPPVEFSLERPVVDGKCYAVFAVKPFRDLPHVCPSNCEEELQRGVFYIRTSDASSRPAYRATELHGIIQRALRNQREMLGRMLRGILYENSIVQQPDSAGTSFFSEELLHSRMFFSKHVRKMQSPCRMEFFVVPGSYRAERNPLPDIRKYAEEAFSLYPEQGPFPEFSFQDAYFTNTSLRGFNRDSSLMMQMWRSGLIHFIGDIQPEEGRCFSFRHLTMFLARATVFAAKYYAPLGYADELLSLNFRMDRTKNLSILTPNGLSGKCRASEINVHRERSASDLSSGSRAHAASLLRSVSERFHLKFENEESFLENINRALQK